MHGPDSIGLTVCDHFVYLATRLGGFPWSRIVVIIIFEQKKGGRN